MCYRSHIINQCIINYGGIRCFKVWFEIPDPYLHVNKTDVLTYFDFILRTINKNLKMKTSGQLKAKLSNLANSDINNYRPSKHAIKKYGILKRLRKNNNIVILRPYKGPVQL